MPISKIDENMKRAQVTEVVFLVCIWYVNYWCNINDYNDGNSDENNGDDGAEGARCSDNSEVLVEEGYLHSLRVTSFIHQYHHPHTFIIINSFTIIIIVIILSDTTEPELTEMSIDEIFNGIPGTDYQV